ncbi:hypothetical protein sos41_11190 [Alphaproteobacteria bacterium SO-S41]|nr:hypothetical protein sos41_11190 [Alphaproteobacteria bacterium SO-S41]
MSNELIAEITAGLAKVIGENSGFGSVLKFDYEGAGVTRVDGKNVPNTVTNEDGPADCTIVISAENLMKMFRRELDPTMAFMQGKMKVNGDMSVAMKLGPILQKAAESAGS